MAIYFTPKAQSDLIAIWEYIAEDNESVADAYISRIQTVCSLLESQPVMGVEREILTEKLRLMPFDKYNIYYLTHNPDVTIIRIRHSAQDPSALTL
ncbi:MAG: type II toxin-antitoxin system RelE/ParE family toxin [Pseudohongiella sp.]|nr:type II toxin-antitoxin system RelE/ParE family toxin [Pseudohongiella sp.]